METRSAAKNKQINIFKRQGTKGKIYLLGRGLSPVLKKKCIYKIDYYTNLGASLIAQLVNHLPAMQETQVRFLGREDLLE